MRPGYLKSILRYDKNTGEFIWIKPTKFHPRMKGMPAGCTTTGYKLIRINGKKYKAHKLAWLYVYGVFPKFEIDHKDGNPLNDSISNLRPCTNAENQANRKRNNSKRLPKGVRKNGNKFAARISFNKRLITIGNFYTAQEASDAYFTKAKEIYGEFARRD